MTMPALAKRLILFGSSATLLGIILYVELGRISGLRLGLAVLNTAAISSISMTLLGLLAALIGGLVWAYHARLVYLPLSGVPLGVAAFLLAELVNINIHGPTGILMFVVFTGLLGSALILLIAAVRFALSRRQRSH
jgi:hypothetical protein